MGTYTLPGKDLARVLLGALDLASTERTLPALCGVRLITDGSQLLAAATDSYIGGVFLICDAPDGAADDVYLAAADVKRLAAEAKASKAAPVALVLSPTGALLHGARGDIGAMAEGSHPPDVLQLMRDKARTGMAAGGRPLDGTWTIAPAILAKLNRIAGDERVRLYGGGGTKPILWALDDAFGCIMPVRIPEHAAFTLPNWALEPRK